MTAAPGRPESIDQVQGAQMPFDRQYATPVHHHGRILFRVTAASVVAVLAACSEQSPTSEPPVMPIVVTSVTPAAAEQGQRVGVVIRGSGFASDDSVSWERGGVVYPGIVVEQVAFVSSVELVATITVAQTADSVVYDVAVSPRKRGIGSERPKGTGFEIFKVNEYRPEALGWIATGVWAGPFSVANAVNDQGVVVGIGGNGSTWSSTAVLWNAGGITPFGGSPGFATGINGRGWIVGTRGSRNDLLFVDPFVSIDGVITNLQPLALPHASFGNAINDAGTVVGHASRDYWADPTWPVVWHRGADGSYGPAVELPLPGGETWTVGQHQEGSAAWDINERGDIVGALRYGTMPDRSSVKAVLWRRAEDGSYGEPLVLGGPNASAYSINEAGWIAGTINTTLSPTGPRQVAVVWRPEDYSTPIRLTEAPVYSVARSLNDAGMVVGLLGTRAVIWQVDPQGGVQEVATLLPSSGYSRAEPRHINANGWVVGYSERNEPTYMEATLWRP
jgi:hypothetical protein